MTREGRGWVGVDCSEVGDGKGLEWRLDRWYSLIGIMLISAFGDNGRAGIICPSLSTNLG